MKKKLHRHPEKEYDLCLQNPSAVFECVVDAEFKDRFHSHRELPNDATHIVVKLCEFFEQTEPDENLGDIVRTGTKVKIIKCPLYPEYVGKEGVVSEWIAQDCEEENVLYVIESDGELLKGFANRDCFEPI